MRDRSCYGIAECANLIMIYIVCLTLMFFGQFWGRKEIIPLSAPILLAEIVFCYFARVKIANFILFFVSHLVVAVGLFFLSSKLGKLELITFFVIFFILDIAFWMRRKGGSFTQIGIAFVILDALAYLHADRITSSTCAQVMSVSMISARSRFSTGNFGIGVKRTGMS